jgi:ATP/maltotriose-dependent transcriptional regulator MalT
MRSAILRTKFFKPESPTNNVVRTHLFDVLSKGGNTYRIVIPSR